MCRKDWFIDYCVDAGEPWGFILYIMTCVFVVAVMAGVAVALAFFIGLWSVAVIVVLFYCYTAYRVIKANEWRWPKCL